MYYGQLGANLFPGEDFKVTVGASVFHYYKDKLGVPTTTPNAGLGLTLNGNNSTEFQLYEGFVRSTYWACRCRCRCTDSMCRTRTQTAR
jgi:hypothetical protein